MSHRSIFWPLALIVVATITLAMIIVSGTGDMGAVTLSAADNCPTDSVTGDYPAICIPTLTAEAQTVKAQTPTKTPDYSGIIGGCPTQGPSFIPPYPPYNDCLLTRTAILGQTARASWTDTPVPAQVQPSATRTPTATYTPTDASAATEDVPVTATQTFTPSATRMALTPTAEDQEEAAAAIACVPGESISIEGSADRGTALIVSFGDRPVGGGFSRSDGSYRIRLHIGSERPGLYPVLVEERDSSAIVQELLCRVPAFTPTPTPPLVP